MRSLLVFISLLSLSVYGQKLPFVNFNHFYTVIDSTDLHAFQKSAFIKNKFAALVTRTTKAGNSETWTGTYFEGLDNYLELFDVSVGDPLGNAGLAFSVDRTGEINQLDSILSRNFTTQKLLREKQYDNKKVLWYIASPEHFEIHFIHRNINDRYAMASIEFETNMPLTDTIRISENIEIRVKNTAGEIIFK
jgi:hypothetical protein